MIIIQHLICTVELYAIFQLYLWVTSKDQSK